MSLSATQDVGVGQDRAARPRVGSTETAPDHAPPAEVTTLPSSSAAVQVCGVGHDTAVTPMALRVRPWASTDRGADHTVPSKVKTFPLGSTAAQKVGVGHDTLARAGCPMKRSMPTSLAGSSRSGDDQVFPS